ncbi:MAG: transporter permease [Bryobacterales bacterium]|jgi:sugar phosphate permease|nr:transporter permease [Bryobacterales bacterium]
MAQPVTASASRPTHVRYVVLGLTVIAYMITYMDRQILATARPVIMKDLGITLATMGWVTFGFRMAYALFQIPGGWLGDTIGARRALAIVVTWWSAFTALTALAWSATSMIVIQVFFGLGEAGAFPIATRSLSRWMRPTERGFAQGITHAGSRLGGAITPPIVALAIMPFFGWRAAFYAFGVLGVVWATVWFFYYRDTPEKHGGVNAAERELIAGGIQRKVSGPVPWRKILSHGNLWVLAVMYFFYNYNLNVYQDWFPIYLQESRGMTLKQMGFYASLPLLAGVVGDLGGGWFSDIVLRRTGNVNLARRWVAIAGFLLSAAATVPAVLTHDPKISVACYCVAFFGLEWTVGISWAVPLDIGGDYAGSVSAVMNMLGNVGGAVAAAVVTYTAAHYGWNVPFLMTAGLCLIAAALYLKIDATRRILG